MAGGADDGGDWDRARVLALGLDAAARQAALTLPVAAWSASGRRGSQAWGRCRGSRATPYEVVVDRVGPRYACTCPSRRLPCKHALALLLQWVAGGLPEAEPPDFVPARLAATGSGTDAGGSKPGGGLADPAAAAARAATRAARVAAGLDELHLWIGDQVRSGLAGLERGGSAAVEAVAARMVDAQAPGVAGMLRALPAELGADGWPERVLDQLAALHLLIQAHRRLGELPPALAATVRSRVGYPVTRNEVLAGPPVADDWLAVGQLDTVEARLETRRVWLWGRRSRRWALWLTFAPVGGTPDSTVTAGARFTGNLHFYPGAGQHRAVVGAAHQPPGPAEPPPAESFAAVRRRFAGLLAEDPWATRMPAVLLAAPVPPDNDRRWRLRDLDGACREVTGLDAEPWPLLAQSRGEVRPVMAEWTPAGVRPLAVLDGAGTDAAVLRAA